MALLEITETDTKTINQKCHNRQALTDAIYKNDVQLANECIRNLNPCEDLDVCTENGEYLIHLATRSGNAELVQAMIDRKVNIHNLDSTGENVLHKAVRASSLTLVHYFVTLNVHLNKRSKSGETPLYLAVKMDCVDIVQYLSRLGVHLDTANNEGCTPLILAVGNGSFDCLRVLLSAQANVSVEDKNGWSPLRHAIVRRHVPAAIVLIKAGSRINHIDLNSNTPLHYSCREGLLPVVQALCAYGCRIDVFNEEGFTPLHLASRSGNAEIVRCLLLAGANAQLATRDGIYAEIMALAQGHNGIASLLSRMKPERRSVCVDQLIPSDKLLPRVKLKVFGHQMSGKTALIEALSCNFISGFLKRKLRSFDTPSNGREAIESFSLRPRNLPTSMNFDVQHDNYTKGIHIQNSNVPGCGEMSIWEFSGYEPYYVAYDQFIGDTNCIHAVCFDQSDDFETRLTKVEFWLNFIRARIPIREPLGYCGTPRTMARVVLVGTHADKCSQYTSQNNRPDKEEIDVFLKTLQAKFNYSIELANELYIVNCNDAISTDMKSLKSKLGDWRNAILQKLPHANGLYGAVSSKLCELTQECTFPVRTWQQFVDLVRSRVNPLCSDDHLKDLIQELQYTGEVIYIESQTDHKDMIIYNPGWFCSEVFGHLLSHDNICQARVTGTFALEDFQFMAVSDAETRDMLDILSAIGLCAVFEADDETLFEFPTLNFVDTAYGLWEREIRYENSFYSGIEFSSRRGQLMHLFPRAQCQLRRSLNAEQGCELNDVIRQSELYQWYHGSKITCGEMECMVTMENADQTITVRCRGPLEQRQVLFGLYHDIVNLVEQTFEDMCPSMDYDIFILSSKDLKQHSPNTRKVHQSEVFKKMAQPENAASPQRPFMRTDIAEALEDLLCFGDLFILSSFKFGPSLHVTCLRSLVLQNVCYLLDPPESFGKDWCLLAVKLGLEQSVPLIDNTSEWSRSRTATIMDEWGRLEDSTLGRLVDVLIDLGRLDVAKVILDNSPIYHFTPLQE